ncbi:hypothetical protein [Amycolatopsis sp. cmx-4-61]|uniref:hypothetical protein n=1 Tax=Amycolatopsis sp. cmx-4-61 TaxID=2790937 RepID=UPI00397A1759
MPLDRNVVNNDVVEFARLGQKVSLKFLVPLRNRATFDKCMATVQGGNSFDPVEVARTIGLLFDDAMDVEFGAEGSAVLYITTAFFPNQCIGPRTDKRHERYTDAERQDYAQRVIDWARTMGANEITVQQHPATDQDVVGKPGEHPYRIRLWWD